MRRTGSLLAAFGSFAVVALVGCNAVLGIDEAHERDGAGASALIEAPSASCNGPSPAECGSCIATSCANSLEKCLQTNDCRLALNDYRKCLGASCSDASCLNALRAGPAQELAGCALGSNECPACPAVTPLADICELYCACMEQPMPQSAGTDAAGSTCEQYVGSNLKDWTAGKRDQCLSACRSLKDPAATHCRWTHCELAQGGEKALHCGHAVGDLRCPLNVAPVSGCTDRRINGWGCNAGSQCCSGTCSDNVCVP